MSNSAHRPDPAELDRCVCGAEIVYFEDDWKPCYGYGCEVVGRPTAAFAEFKED